MYTPHIFKNENIAEVKDFIKANSFGILLTSANNKMLGTHIPLELEQDMNGVEVIYGHVSKANPQWRNFDGGQEVLMIFNGPHAYVSSSWYNHENVSTWNYIAVHIYGTIQPIGEEELRYSLDKLVTKYESDMKKPLLMKDMSEETMKQINGIVGFKVNINEIQAAYKLSQNRNELEYRNIVQELDKREGALGIELSKCMRDRGAKL